MNDQTAKPRPGTGIFYAFATVASLTLLLLVPAQTKPGPADQGWWTQPALMPRLSLLLMLLTSAYLLIHHLVRLRRHPDIRPHSSELRAELIQWIKPLEYFVYYVIYIWLFGTVGYLLSTLTFVIGLSLRVGLRSARWLLIGLLTTIGLVILFRWGLRVWVPPAELYELFPSQIRSILIRYF